MELPKTGIYSTKHKAALGDIIKLPFWKDPSVTVEALIMKDLGVTPDNFYEYKVKIALKWVF